MFDLAAPIVPGHSAAGYIIGMPAGTELEADVNLFHAQAISDTSGRPTGIVRYRSANVDLWLTQGIISQIGVHDAYQGWLLDAIRLGMTIDDIERRIGPCMEDDEDNLRIKGVEGLVFNVDWHPIHFVAEVDWAHPALRLSPITWIYVYDAARDRLAFQP